MTGYDGVSSPRDHEKKIFLIHPFPPALLQWSELGDFDQVFVCDEMASFEGLVNRCRQVDISISRGKTMKVRKSSVLL